MSDIDIVEMTVEKVQAAFSRGDMTAAALTQAFLDHIAAYNPHDHAIIFLNPGALDDARAVDMVGFPTTAGWSLLCSKTPGVDLIPGTGSPVVAWLRAAGTVIRGKTNVPVLSPLAASSCQVVAVPAPSASPPAWPCSAWPRRPVPRSGTGRHAAFRPA